MRWNHHHFLSPVQVQGQLKTWLSCVANVQFSPSHGCKWH